MEFRFEVPHTRRVLTLSLSLYFSFGMRFWSWNTRVNRADELVAVVGLHFSFSSGHSRTPRVEPTLEKALNFSCQAGECGAMRNGRELVSCDAVAPPV